MIDRDQIRAARAALGWTAEDLADKSGLSIATIRRAESEKGRVPAGNMYLIQRAFEEEGVVFLEPNQASAGGGRGIRWVARDE